MLLRKLTSYLLCMLLVGVAWSTSLARDVLPPPSPNEIVDCEADAGALLPDLIQPACYDGVVPVTLTAKRGPHPNVPHGFSLIYVLTSGPSLVIEAVSDEAKFEVEGDGRFTIHTLVYDPHTLDLSVVEFGTTTGGDVINLINDNDICASLDVEGAPFDVEDCGVCVADAGTLRPASSPGCVDGVHEVFLKAQEGQAPTIPNGYEKLFVLTKGDDLVIQKVSAEPAFGVMEEGLYTIHTLIYNPLTLDLSVVELGQTTGGDVLALVAANNICASLDVAGVAFEIEACTCTADAGTLAANEIDCLEGEGMVTLTASRTADVVVPDGYSLLYVLTSGEDLVIQNVGDEPSFEVDMEGRYTIHTLVYDPNTLDLGVVVIGETTGGDVLGIVIENEICASLDVAGAPFDVEACEECTADAGTLEANEIDCLEGEGMVTLTASRTSDAVIPDGYSLIYVLTSGEDLVIQNVGDEPSFEVDMEGRYTIHTLVYDPNTLDLGVVVIGETTGGDVLGIVIENEICASLDVAGAPFDVLSCDACTADAGTLEANEIDCLEDEGMVTLTASRTSDAVIPDGYSLIYVLTSGEDLVIQNVGDEPSFEVDMEGRYTIHTLVYDPNTLDLGVVVIGETTGGDVLGIVIENEICASLDVAGAPFDVLSCDACTADAGTLEANEIDCLEDEGMVTLTASRTSDAVIPDGYSLIYVLTSGEDLVIQNVGDEPSFEVDMEGRYTIHTLVYDPNTLDLGVVVIGETTGGDVLGIVIENEICASLDVAGAPFDVLSCDACTADAGTLEANEIDCLEGEGMVTLTASRTADAVVPDGYSLIYVLTSGEDLVIQNVGDEPSFEVDMEGRYTIHTLVYDPNTLDLGVVVIGETTGGDVLGIVIENEICASLDVAGAPFDVEACAPVCEADAGTLRAGNTPGCFDGEKEIFLKAREATAPTVPDGYSVLYVLTKGTDLVIQNVNTEPVFGIRDEGLFTIHTLVYDPNTLDLSVVVPGQTTGGDVLGIVIENGICASLDVAGVPFMIDNCATCKAEAGTLAPMSSYPRCFDGSLPVTIKAERTGDAFVPNGYSLLYVLTSGTDLVIENVGTSPMFEVSGTGRYTIHTLVYDPATLDLGIVEIGQTTGVDVLNLVIENEICAALDVAGAAFDIEDCGDCTADAGTLRAGNTPGCLTEGREVFLKAREMNAPIVPAGYQVLFVLTKGSDLVIQNVSTRPVFGVRETGLFTIHTLVYDPATLDLSVVVPGQTTGVDVLNLVIDNGICASLDVAGVSFDITACEGFMPIPSAGSSTATGSAYEIYPNPVVSQLFVRPMVTKTGTYQISLYSMDNREVYRADVENMVNGHKMDVSKVSKGYYYLMIREPDQLQHIEKIVISR